MAPQPTYLIRIHAVVLANDNDPIASDCSNSVHPTFTSTQIKKMVDGANEVWNQAGLHLVFDPSVDISAISSTRLNSDVLPEDYITHPENPVLGSDIPRLALVAQFVGKVVVFFRDSYAPKLMNYSGPQDNSFVAMWKPAAAPYTFAHELGHYMGLDHPFSGFETVEQVRQEILKVFGPKPPADSVVINHFDGDAATIMDTPADPGTGVFEDAYNYIKGDCSSFAKVPSTITIEVPFASGKRKYTFAPDVHNIMSYFPHCPGVTYLTQGQIRRVREKIENGNRKHLIIQRLASIGGKITGAPSVVSWGKNRLDITVRGVDGRVFHKAHDNGKWFPSNDPNHWDILGSQLTDSPSVVTWGPGRLDIVVRGVDGRVYHKAHDNGKWFPSNDPNQWDLVGGQITGTPSVVSWGPGRLDITVRGVDGRVYHKAYDNGKWFPSNDPNHWDILGSQITDSPSVVSWGPGRLDIVVRGIDGRVYHKAYDNGKWFPSNDPNHWDLVGGQIMGTPSVVSWGPGRLDITVRGTDGQVYHKAHDNGKWFPSNDPNHWDILGGQITDSPSVVTWGPGRLDIAVRGVDGRVYHKAHDNGKWFPSNEPNHWDILGGQIIGTPSIVSSSKGRLDVFAQGADGSVVQKYWAGHYWMPWP